MATNTIKELDRLYKEWSGVSHLENSNTQIHDSAEAQDFARYCIDNFGNTLEEIKNMVAKFSDETFGTERPFTAPLYHLKKEVDEAIESGEMEEFVDMQLLLLDAFRKRFPELTTQDLLDFCHEKITVVLPARRWGKPDKNGVFEHIRHDGD